MSEDDRNVVDTEHSTQEGTGSSGQEESGEEPNDEDQIVEVNRSDLEQLRAKRDEYEDKYLRKVADLQNLRKRKKREREEYKKYAHEDVARDLLEIVDNFERALDNMNFENESVREGVEMIRDQMLELLSKYDVEPMEAEGETFDPHRHEAMMKEEREDLDEQTVLEVFKQGYTLHDRVLRAASVKVGMPAKQPQAESAPSEGE